MNHTQTSPTPDRRADDQSIFSKKISRAGFLKTLGFAASVAVVGCMPAKILLKAYPNQYDKDTSLDDAVMHAFVSTIIPGAPADDSNSVRIYHDENYPFHSYLGFFVSDLCRRSADKYGVERFDLCSQDQRAAIVRDGLNSDAISARLYRGAVFMAQVSVYSSIYDDDRGCALIGFEGSNGGFRREEMCYPNNAARIGTPITRDGIFQ